MYIMLQDYLNIISYTIFYNAITIFLFSLAILTLRLRDNIAEEFIG